MGWGLVQILNGGTGKKEEDYESANILLTVNSQTGHENPKSILQWKSGYFSLILLLHTFGMLGQIL